MQTGFGSKRKRGKSFGLLDIFILCLYAGAGAALVWFAAMNIAPYKALLDNAGAEFVKNGFMAFVLWLPLIGNLFRTLGNATVWIGAFMIWLPVQIVEVLPGVLWRHHGFLEAVVSASDSNGYVAIKDNDGVTIKSAKKTLNNFIDGFLRQMWLYCIGAYLIDLAICCWYYPLIPGVSWDKAVSLLLLGQWRRINTANLFGVISTLFAVEIVVHVLISVWMLYKFLKGSSNVKL
ncbi:MAG: hypothetical protein KME29_04970 [Calothrix sp. FI2-JRJ7]|jgi:uncharacterized membrane protein|nr:hypothetical protein [Calothrix sp. FI2-JRJ7]